LERVLPRARPCGPCPCFALAIPFAATPAPRVSRLGSLRCAAFTRASLLSFLALAWTIHAQNTPHIGYVYPAGGRQGATFQVVVGGQYLGSVSNALVSGSGVDTALIEYNRPLNPKEFNDLRNRLRELQDKRRTTRRIQDTTNTWTAANEKEMSEIQMRILKNPPNRLGNPAIAETVTIRITLATNAEPGDREIRLVAPNGLSNPLLFSVGHLSEFSKPPSKLPNPDLDRFLERLGRKPAPVNYESRIRLPAVANGQIMPGGADRYRFSAGKGQRLVVAAAARGLVPYLPDAVPGWFQAVLTLYDAKGNELAYADDFRFNPDPVLYYEIARDGEYIIEIKDAIYRGREDFVYRIAIGELPFVTSVFPLGCQEGVATTVEFQGWNLLAGKTTPDSRLVVAQTNEESNGNVVHATSDRAVAQLPTAITQQVRFTEPGVYQLSTTNGGRVSNLVPFAVDTLPDCLEQEPNDAPETAQPVALPIIINGRIGQPGDADLFRFEARAGTEIVAEINARRLNSPLDSMLRLTDAAGKQIAFSDDYEDKRAGLETHHADSYLCTTLPTDGTFFVRLTDTQHKGGPEFGYRLRLSPPQPDFALRVVPASLSVRAGMSVPLTVYALRKDGFTNEITLMLDEAPAGSALSGNRVPPNQDQARLTLKAPPAPSAQPAALSLKGFAFIGSRAIFRPAVPAEDMIQAFAYRHLVPARELRVVVLESRRPSAMAGVRILSPTPVRLQAGGTAMVRVATPGMPFANRFEFELSGPPEGVTLQSVSPVAEGIELELKCDAAKTESGLRGNLIVNVLQAQNRPRPQELRPPAARRRVPVGTLPAIPFEIVPQQ
jgi:hypothetical protein